MQSDNKEKRNCKTQQLPCHCRKCRGKFVSRQTSLRHLQATYPEEKDCSSQSDGLSDHNDIQEAWNNISSDLNNNSTNYDFDSASDGNALHVNDVQLSEIRASEDDASDGDISDGDASEVDVSMVDVSDIDARDGYVSDTDASEVDVSDIDARDGNVSDTDASEVDVSDIDARDGNVSDTDASEVGDDENIERGSTMSIDDGNEAEAEMNDKIDKFILRTLKAKVKFGWSREEALQQLQNFYEHERNERIPHTSWHKVMHFLRGIGYKDPHAYKVCFSDNHVELLHDQDEQCPICFKPRKNCVDYYVLGLNLQDMFCSQDFAKQIMAHWENKDEWFYTRNPIYPKIEEWHGSRFQELSYFWDKDTELLLPGKCENCQECISVHTITEIRERKGIVDATQPFRMKCRECQHVFLFKPRFLKGCPLNQALIFHEDGFNSFTKKTRGIATIQLSSACTYKESRSSGVSFQVYSFIPTCYISDGIIHKLDAFFKPLFDEIDQLYRYGTSITLLSPLHLRGCVIHSGEYQVRALLLLGTADLKTHQEIALYAGGGKCGCRKCLVIGLYIAEKRHYYYGNFRERYRTTSKPRTAEYLYQHGKKCEEARTVAEQKLIQRETGVKGVSILFQLHKLYGFDPVKDMVIDRMHVCFNMLKREFTTKIWADIGPNADVDVNDRDPAVGGLVDRNDFAKSLNAVNWTTEQKASGAARLKSLTDQLGGWKTAEYNKFSQVAREVLAGLIPSKAYDCFMLLCEAHNMLYSKELRHSGWTKDNISRLNDLLWSHAIHFEEYYGIDSCTENLEYSTHIASDIHRHSSPDNYTCELYERGIRIHKQQKNNSKSIEKTLTLREGLRQFISVYERQNGSLSQLQQKPQYNFDPDQLDRDQPFFLHESSFESAKLLMVTFRGTSNERMLQALSNGICLGKMKQKPIEQQVARDIKQHLQHTYSNLDIQVPSKGHIFQAIVKETSYGDISRFKAGDVCILEGGPNLEEEWVLKLSSFVLVGPIGGCFHSFVDGEYYIPAYDNNRKVVTHPWTKTIQLLPRNYTRGKMQPTTAIKRRCLLHPDPSNLESPSHFLVIDFEKPESSLPVQVPVFPKCGDDVEICGPRKEKWYGQVYEVNIHNRSTKVTWYNPTTRQGVWSLGRNTDKVNFSSILALVEFHRVSGGPRRFRLA